MQIGHKMLYEEYRQGICCRSMSIKDLKIYYLDILSNWFHKNMSLWNPSYTHDDIRAMLLNEFPVFKWNTNDENTL